MDTYLPTTVLIFGMVIVAVIFIRSLLDRIHVPAVAGYIIFGLILRGVINKSPVGGENFDYVFDFLGNIGIFALLFRVGLESNFKSLVKRLPKASIIWVSDVLLSGIIAYLSCYLILGIRDVSSLVIATSLTASSVAVTLQVWRKRHALKTKVGETLLDVAEMDDISGIILLAILISFLPLDKLEHVSLSVFLGTTIGWFLLKLILIGIACLLFSLYLESPITSFFKKIEGRELTMILVVGISLIVASITDLVGYSVAIGGFFAGLIFSRDPEAVKIDAAFEPLFDLFTPFFYILIGFKIDVFQLTFDPGMILSLLAIAVIGKLVANLLPSIFTMKFSSAITFSASMVPRGSICLILLKKANELGEHVLSDQLFADAVFAILIILIFAAIILNILLKKYPQTEA